MYKVLDSEINGKGINKVVMAKELQMGYSTLLSKLSGKDMFTLDEAMSIQKYLGEEIPIEVLFRNDT